MFLLFTRYFAKLGLFLSILCPNALAHGKVIVANDEWTLSDAGFSRAPDTPIYVRNMANWFTGGARGNFLAYSLDFGFAGSSLANTLRNAGHSWTVSVTVPFNVQSLLAYDGIFLAGPVNGTSPDNQVIIDYVRRGGNVYLAAGTHDFGSARAEADAWRVFLAEMDLAYEDRFNGIHRNISVSSSTHPVMAGVSELYQFDGNSIIDLDTQNPTGEIIVADSGQGLWAAATTAPHVELPEPGLSGQPNSLAITGVPIGLRVTVAYSLNLGTQGVRGCPNLTVDLDRPYVLGSPRAGLNCTAFLQENVPAKMSGTTVYLQAVVRATCRKSKLVSFTFP